MKLTKTLFAISDISIFAVACKSTGFNFGGETTNLTDIKKVCVVPHKVEFRNIALEKSIRQSLQRARFCCKYY